MGGRARLRAGAADPVRSRNLYARPGKRVSFDIAGLIALCLFLRTVDVFCGGPEVLEMARNSEVLEALENMEFFRLASDPRTTVLFNRVLDKLHRQQR